MRSPRKTTTLIVVGAAGLASAAYGLGTQIDGGSASAARDSSAQGDWRYGSRDGGADLDALAEKLGVTAAQLRDAFADFHADKRGDGRDAFASALAEALGKPAAEVEQALDSLHERRLTRFATKLADALGVDAADVKAALEELKDDDSREFGDFPADLAEKLGLEAADVEDALRELRPDEMRGDRHGMSLRRLAAALDVTRAELRKALREMQSGADERFEERRAELVEFLAERFNLSKEKVEDALPDFAGPGGPGGRGPGGPGFGGPGGPGFGGPHGPGPGGPGFGP